MRPDTRTFREDAGQRAVERAELLADVVQVGAPTYEQRFAEWLDHLKTYERACDALAAAAELEIGVAA